MSMLLAKACHHTVQYTVLDKTDMCLAFVCLLSIRTCVTSSTNFYIIN